MFRELAACVLVLVGVVCGQGPPGGFGGGGFGGGGGGGGFNCPQENGQFEFSGDCTRFWQCDGGAATVIDCPPQLIFNAQVGYCDWPFRVPNADCSPPGRSGLTPESENLCRNSPYQENPAEAFIVPHPQLCNAFYTCSSAFLFAPCTFCGEGMYFSTDAGACRDYLSTGQDVNALCQGRQFVEHGDKVFRTLDGSCWPFSNIPNPYQPLLASIQGGGGQPGGFQQNGGVFNRGSS